MNQEDKENIEVIEACNYGESATLWLLRQYFAYRTIGMQPQRAYAQLLGYIQEQITKRRDLTQ